MAYKDKTTIIKSVPLTSDYCEMLYHLAYIDRVSPTKKLRQLVEEAIDARFNSMAADELPEPEKE